MASNTQITRKKRNRRDVRAGRERKNRQGRRSTPSAEEVFAEVDEKRRSA